MSDLFSQASKAPKNVRHFSLSALQQHLHRVVTLNMRKPLWIHAEVTQLSQRRGHWYIDLIEKEHFQIKAQARAFIWKTQYEKLLKQRGSALKQLLQKGYALLLYVHVEYHPRFGMQLIVEDIDPTYTLGDVEQQRLAHLQTLQAHPDYRRNKNQALAAVPQRLAVISSAQAAGLQDFYAQLAEHPANYAFKTTLFEARVQGAQAAQEIIQQLKRIEAVADDYDAIVLLRGGGARLDLISFDDLDLCIQLAQASRPVLTGIGHETDESLADQVAHTALKTPTAVAAFLLQRVETFEQSLLQVYTQIHSLSRTKLQRAQFEQQTLRERLHFQSRRVVQQARHELDHLNDKLKWSHPTHRLQQGKALLWQQGQRIKTLTEIDATQPLQIQMADGLVEIHIDKIKPTSTIQ